MFDGIAEDKTNPTLWSGLIFWIFWIIGLLITGCFFALLGFRPENERSNATEDRYATLGCQYALRS